MKALCLLSVFLLGIAGSNLFAGGHLKGQALSPNNEPVRDAEIFLIGANRKSRPDQDGRFAFLDLKAGDYTLRILSDEYGSVVRDIIIEDGQTNELTIYFDVVIHEAFTVTASPKVKSISDVNQAVDVLNEQDLLEKLQPTLGETLAEEAGVSSTHFGAGSSRPVIRGLGGDRVRMLEGGLDVGDASSVSADHAVGVDLLGAESIEIVRGPAGLRYGSSAVGGVVNIIDNRIPEFLPSEKIAGTLELRADTAADERTAGLVADGALGRIAWHAAASTREADPYEIPGVPEIDPPADETFGPTLENSWVENKRFTAGLSYVRDRGFIGLSFSNLDNQYGVPGHEHAHDHDHDGDDDHDEGEDHHDEDELEDEPEEESVSIDMEDRRWDMAAGFNFQDFWADEIRFRMSSVDYEHQELEGEAIGTLFTNDYLEARTEITHSQLGPFTSGAFGIQYSDRDFEAVGEEAFVDPNQTEKLGIFAYEEIDFGHWSASFGARLQRQSSKGSITEHEHEHEDDHDHEEEGEPEEEEHEEGETEYYDISFNGTALAAGLVYGKTSPYSIGMNLTRTDRAPTPEELFSLGPHLATRSFELGDPNLSEETSTGFDILLRKKEGRLTGELSLFYNRFDGYIYQRFTGEEEDGLDVYRFSQADADFTGGEAHLDFSLIHRDPHHLDFELFYDWVRAELEDGSPLPRITPARYGAWISYRGERLWAKVEARVTEDQDRVAAFETPTDGHTMINALIGYRFLIGTSVNHLLLRGTNLGDEEARNHVSFLKNDILLPGRNLTLSYRVHF